MSNLHKTMMTAVFAIATLLVAAGVIFMLRNPIGGARRIAQPPADSAAPSEAASPAENIMPSEEAPPARPDAVEPGAAEPGVTEPGAAESGAIEPGVPGAEPEVQPSDVKPSVCAGQGGSMPFDEARALAAGGECGQIGMVGADAFCNPNSVTWWFDLAPIELKAGCNPACVVHVADKSVEVNWRCTGLMPPR